MAFSCGYRCNKIHIYPTECLSLFPECLFLPETILLRWKTENKGMLTEVLKRRFCGSGVVAAVFTLEDSNSDGYF